MLYNSQVDSRPLLGWLKQAGQVYFHALAMLGLFLLSVIVDLSSNIQIMLAFSAALMALGSFMLHSKRRRNAMLSEDQTEVPAFIVRLSGEIQSSNQLGFDYVVQANRRFENLLKLDGFDDGAAYRLLSVANEAVHSEIHHHIIYKCRRLNSKEVLITRTQNIQLQLQLKPVTDNKTLQDHKADPKKSIFDDLPFGYFEKSSTSKDVLKNCNNDILEMNKTLQDWVDKDTELFEYIHKYGAETAHYSAKSSDTSFLSIKNNSDIDLSGFFKVFQLPAQKKLGVSDDDIAEKLRAFVIPIDHKEQQNDFVIHDDLPTKIFKNSPVSAVVVDEEFNIIEYNQAFLCLFDIDADVDNIENIRNYFPEGERSKLNASDETKSIEILVTKPKERILSLKMHFCMDTKKRICYFQDISNEKSLEQKFNQAQKMQAIGQLAGGVAHDFNNLLTAIGGHTELLMNRFTASDFAYADLLQIRNNVNRAGNLVRQLLAFSRRQTLKPEIVTLTDILPDLSRMLERLIGDQILLKTEYAPSLKPIKADITQLEQVIINLGVNARDAMHEKGGTLTINTQNITADDANHEGHDIMPSAEYVKITVSDTGHGMSDDVREKIFEPFFTTKPQGEGTGLGLSTVYGIIKQSGGFVFVDSEENKGTDFRIYFPVAHEESTMQVVKDQEISSQQSLDDIIDAPHTKTVLVVEDEESVRAFVVRALQLKGYQILEADCGEDALEVFEAHYEDIDIVITDVMMPGLSGPEWIKQAQDLKSEFSVIFMSGYTQDYFRDDSAFELPGLEAGFLSKPFTLKTLNEAVKQHIS